MGIPLIGPLRGIIIPSKAGPGAVPPGIFFAGRYRMPRVAGGVTPIKVDFRISFSLLSSLPFFLFLLPYLLLISAQYQIS